MSKIFAFVRDESGATAIEYGLIAALIVRCDHHGGGSWSAPTSPLPSTRSRRGEVRTGLGGSDCRT